jgi:hypothetical protein
LKAVTVMVICGVIFIYYLGSLHWDRDTNVALVKTRSFRFGVGASVVVAIAFLLGLGVAGTPAAQRRIEADHRRIQDLRAIALAVHSRYQRAGKSDQPMPFGLSELVGKGIPHSQSTDPETGQAYEYRVESGTQYQLCAVFAGAEETDQFHQTQFWHHDQGRTCFTLDASTQPAW